MNDFPHDRTDDVSKDDKESITQLASNYLQEGESLLDIRVTGRDSLQVNIGIIISKKAGSGRKLTVENVEGHWTVTDVRWWIA